MKKILVLLICIITLISVIVFFISRNSFVDPNKDYFGISGFAPANYPNFTEEDANNYWKDINSSANIYGVHSSLINADVVNLYTTNLKMPVYLLINESDIYNLDKLYTILDSNSQIIYLGIGNEINLLYKDNPVEYTTFLNKAKEVFPMLKKKYPKLELFTVFQYESLIGKGYLFGETFEDSTKLILDWNDIVDFFGLSVYPHFDYGTPQDLPSDYFDKFTKLATKRFGITETTWPSNLTSFSADDFKFNTTKTEQSDYIEWIRQINVKYNPKFINWLFLNDIEFGNAAFSGAALRDNSGNAKPAFAKWLTLLK